MADSFCTFLDFRSLATKYNFNLFLPPKHYYPSAFVHSHNSRIKRIKRRPFHLTLLSQPSYPTPSSSDFDVISTHEHTDGSLLFRFGDPSEVAKDVKIEESNNLKEETEKENETGYVKVLDRDHEKEVMLEIADREITGSSLTEVADHTNSKVISDESITVSEGESDSCKKLLEGSDDVELPISISSKELEVSSTPGVDIEHSINVEEGINEEYEDLSPANTSILDRSFEMENNITTEELSEKGTADNSTPGIDIEQNGNIEGSLNEDQVDSSPSDASIIESNSEMENYITTILDLLLPDPVITVPDNDFAQATADTVITTDVSAVSEYPNVESEMQNEIIEDGRESLESELVSPLPQSEPAISLSEEIEEPKLQDGMQDLIIGKGSEVSNEIVECGDGSDMIQLMTVSSQLEAESVFDEETGIEAVEESREDDVAESLKLDLILGSERNEGDRNVQSGDSVEASVHEVTELKSSESTTVSQEIISPDFVLASGAALLPHPSKVLTGGEDSYFIAGQTWLGVADGVGQWSLQGNKPGVYAQELMKNCERLISNCNGDSVNSPLELLKLCVAETDSAGSSTVLIAQFDGQALHVANIGDSGFIVLRHGAIYKRSSPMHHASHFPKQIERGDDPSSLAELYRIDLEEEDVIITATDGLLDNLYDQEISSIVEKSLAADKKKPEEIAELLATEAQERGGSPSARSPFGDDAQAAGFTGYTGGKLDDIALIVSVVGRQP